MWSGSIRFVLASGEAKALYVTRFVGFQRNMLGKGSAQVRGSETGNRFDKLKEWEGIDKGFGVEAAALKCPG